jgi:hypothetical protein
VYTTVHHHDFQPGLHGREPLAEVGRDVAQGAGDVFLLLADGRDVVQGAFRRVVALEPGDDPGGEVVRCQAALRLALGSADLDSLRQALIGVREVVEADPYW